MLRLPYPVLCQARGCTAPAAHKIAARWSDGTTCELKTYSLCCAACLPAELASARARRASCLLTDEEELDDPAVYSPGPGGRDILPTP